MNTTIEKWKKISNRCTLKIMELEQDLKTAETNNRRHAELTAELEEVSDAQTDVLKYLSELHTASTIAKHESSEYKTRRKNFFDDAISDLLFEVFPDRGYRASLEFDESHRKETVTLTLNKYVGDTIAEKRLPYVSEGMLLQYIASFAATCAIVSAMGGQLILLDEAFSVANESKLPSLGDNVQQIMSAHDMQCIVISQNKSLYEHLPHRLFELSLEMVDGVETTTITRITDN